MSELPRGYVQITANGTRQAVLAGLLPAEMRLRLKNEVAAYAAASGLKEAIEACDLPRLSYAINAEKVRRANEKALPDGDKDVAQDTSAEQEASDQAALAAEISDSEEPLGVGSTLSQLEIGRATYRNVTVTAVWPDRISIRHDSGTGTFLFDQLPENIRQRLGYDAAKAAEHREQERQKQLLAEQERIAKRKAEQERKEKERERRKWRRRRPIPLRRRNPLPLPLLMTECRNSTDSR